MESKKYNKLVNITKKKRTNREQTSGHRWGKRREGQIGGGEWEIPTTGFKISSRMYYAM